MKPKTEYAPMSAPPQPKSLSEMRAPVQKSQEDFEKMIVTFMDFMQQKKLDKNKTVQEKDRENALFAKLIRAAEAVENIDQSKGSFGLSIVSIRTAMFINNKLNEVLYRLDQLEKENERGPDSKDN